MPAPRADSEVVRGGIGLRRLQVGAAAALLVLPSLFLLQRVLFDPTVPFLFGDTEHAAWITLPRDPSLEVVIVDPTEPQPLIFSRTFTLSRRPEAAVLHVRVLREVDLFVNSQRIPREDEAPQGFRSVNRVEITAKLRAGENEIRAEVRNPTGPRLLLLWADGLPERIATGPEWTAAVPGRTPVRAMLADDTARNPQAQSVRTPREALARRGAVVAGLFAVGFGSFLLARRRLDDRVLEWLPLVTLLTLTAAWVWIFATKTTQLPLAYGFDSRGHLRYIDYILEQGSLPRPGGGWSMSHPPLFYALSAGFEWLTGLFASDARRAIALRVLPFLSGLGIVWLTWPLARRFFPEDSRRVTVALLVAGILPMNLYLSAYINIESPHAFFATACILATVGALLEPTGRLRPLLLAGVAFGVALLTKVTAVIPFALAGLFLLWKLIAVERRSIGRSLPPLALFALGPLLIAGWYFAWNLADFGTPLVDNWANRADRTWWQHPGFHTPAYFLSFGESFQYPYLSSFRSFWDGLYTTLWGDGQISGLTFVKDRHPFWNYDYMSITFLLAFPATLLLLVGFVRIASRAWRETDPRRQLVLLFLLTLSAFMAFALAYWSLTQPIYASTKSSYALLMVAPLALLLAEGFCTVDNALAPSRWLVLRTLHFAWFGTFLTIALLSFAG